MDPTLEAMMVAGTCGSRPEAELKRGALADAGIRVRFASDDADGLHLDFAYGFTSSTYRLLVPASELDEARELLGELDRGDHAIPAAVDDHAAPSRPHRTPWALTVIGVLIVAAIMFQVLAPTVDIAGF